MSGYRIESGHKKGQVKVLLINPPQRFFTESLGFNVYFPLGLLNIAAMIKDICNVRILDCLTTDFQIQKTGKYVIYGTPFEKIKEVIEDFNPSVVGITIPFSAQAENPKIISRICRGVNPDIRVVFGGPHPSVRYDTLLQEESCDYCVIGEGEETFREFIENIIVRSEHPDIDGLAYKKGNKIKYTPRKALKYLDALPLPAYDLINVDDYLESPYLYKSRSTIGSKSISMITSRGCPYNCVFCSIELHMGKIFRYHSPDYVVRHLKYCINELGIKKFHFEDDNVSMNKSRFEDLLDRIIDENLEISWDTPNGIRADSLDYNLLKKIKRSGCSCLQIAIESGSQRVLDEVIKKKSSLEYILKIPEYCKELKIRLGAFYVIGFPGEKLSDIRETVNIALQLYKSFDVFPVLLFATPLYGTELYRICIEQGLIDRNITDEEIATATQFYGNPLISTKDFSKDDLREAARAFEMEMNTLMGEGVIRKVLTDKNSLFDSIKYE